MNLFQPWARKSAVEKAADFFRPKLPWIKNQAQNIQVHYMKFWEKTAMEIYVKSTGQLKQ